MKIINPITTKKELAEDVDYLGWYAAMDDIGRIAVIDDPHVEKLWNQLVDAFNELKDILKV